MFMWLKGRISIVFNKAEKVYGYVGTAPTALNPFSQHGENSLSVYFNGDSQPVTIQNCSQGQI
jgi:hypothetical protein